MAEDLVDIVPEDGARSEPERLPAPAEPAAAASESEAEPPYESRFQLLFGVLLGIGLAAVVATVLVVVGGKKGSDPGAATWAPWRPTATDGMQAVQQIADHVGQRYTLPSGKQLAFVRGGPMELLSIPVTVVLQEQGDEKILDARGVLYNICGVGKSCSIKEGKPTLARSLVLRREALELALYTFRYVKNVDQVVAILPPKPGTQPTYAMFFRRGDVGRSLDRPLSATLPGVPPVPPALSKSQQDAIDRLTSANFFSFSPEQGADAHVYFVLSPAG